MAKPVNVHYSVEGRGEFPLDMLRYDDSRPASESDCRVIRNSIAGDVRDPGKLRQVDLVRKHDGGKAHAEFWMARMHERWESFGWLVKSREVRGR